LLTAEVLGARRCILVKDERGLYTDDPKRSAEASFIPEIRVDELVSLELPDLPVERAMLAALQRARSVQEVVIVDGRAQGGLTAALRGENPGTRILRGPGP
jgi:molybdenum storage protein